MSTRHHRNHKQQNQNWRNVATSLMVLALFIHQTQATLFLIGTGCVVGTNVVLSVGEEALPEDLNQSLRVIRNLCRGLNRFTVEGQVVETIEPELRRFVNRLPQGNFNFDLQANLEGLVQPARRLAD